MWWLPAQLLLAQLDPAEIARIDAEQKDAAAAIEKKYGGRTGKELSLEERKAQADERAAAERAVLEQHGVSPKDWVKANARQSCDDREAVKAESEKLARAKAEAQKPKPAEPPREIPVQRGISDKNPVVLEEKESSTPAVEQGLPAEAQDDQDALDAANGTGGDAPKADDGKTEPKPAKASKKKH
ncbi:MAG: hypothetical protein K1X89_12205 [Myxococcaceae bacterium]|nr:hypothetical protein [Myxococcaceae bacterium]